MTVSTDFRVLVAGSRPVSEVAVEDIVRAYWGAEDYEVVTGGLPDGDALLVRFDPESDTDRGMVHAGMKKGMGVLVLGPDGILPVEAVPAAVEPAIPEQRPAPEAVLKEILAGWMKKALAYLEA